ncbi:hypothetical protein R1flu_007084 [Riccia fluitans]|uniref:Uncharacterized protein n=1 Tax=Riccia fluitans TaxID=41844 RepID=A0ABD1YYP4_9MARC
MAAKVQEAQKQAWREALEPPKKGRGSSSSLLSEAVRRVEEKVMTPPPCIRSTEGERGKGRARTSSEMSAFLFFLYCQQWTHPVRGFWRNTALYEDSLTTVLIEGFCQAESQDSSFGSEGRIIAYSAAWNLSASYGRSHIGGRHV